MADPLEVQETRDYLVFEQALDCHLCGLVVPAGSDGCIVQLFSPFLGGAFIFPVHPNCLKEIPDGATESPVPALPADDA